MIIIAILTTTMVSWDDNWFFDGQTMAVKMNINATLVLFYFHVRSKHGTLDYTSYCWTWQCNSKHFIWRLMSFLCSVIFCGHQWCCDCALRKFLASWAASTTWRIPSLEWFQPFNRIDSWTPLDAKCTPPRAPLVLVNIHCIKDWPTPHGVEAHVCSKPVWSQDGSLCIKWCWKLAAFLRLKDEVAPFIWGRPHMNRGCQANTTAKTADGKSYRKVL